MTVELNPNYPSDLDSAIPTNLEFKSEGDDHLRNIKRVVKTTFPNITGAVTATHTKLNLLTSATLTTAELNTLTGITATAAELNALDGITSTVAELNILDGVTATAAELNALDGITATVTELNYTDGVNNPIQTQLDSLTTLKAPLASPILTGVPVAPTAAPGTASTQIATTAFTDALVTATAFTSTLPGQVGNSGKYITTNGTAASWAVPTGLEISNTPAGTIAATTVQAALNELDTEKQVTLVSGTSIKTIDGVSLLGSGDITRSPGDHAVIVTTGNGYGSTNTKIRRYTTTQSSVGSHITYADSATNGASFTIAAGGAGLYSIYVLDYNSSALGAHGASKNSTQLTTDIVSITAADRVLSVLGSTGQPCSITTRLAEGDVIRPHHGSGSLPDTSIAARSVFAIRKVGL